MESEIKTRANLLTEEEKQFILKHGSRAHILSLSNNPKDKDILIRYYELLNKYNA